MVTRFHYYAESDWNGRQGSQPTLQGGGMLGKIEEDAENNPERDRHFPNVPLRTRVTRFRYDELGNVDRRTDPTGVTTRYEFGKQHELLEETRGFAVAAPASPQPVTWRHDYSSRGDLTRTLLEQPGASDWEGGALQVEEWDVSPTGYGRSHQVARHLNHPVAESFEPDNDERLSVYRTPGHTDFSDATIHIERDGRGLPEAARWAGGTVAGLTVGLYAAGSRAVRNLARIQLLPWRIRRTAGRPRSPR
jgi:hypothetical protein